MLTVNLLTVKDMHAYLLVGTKSEELKVKSEELARKLKAKILEFPIKKIEDTRNLNNLIRLSFNEPTLIVCERIHEATEESLNAFLKNLEEPQENIYFALTAPSVRKVLPTIVSRCAIIRIRNQESGILDEETEEFLNMTIGEKLNYIDKIKDREKAIELVENMAIFLHSQLHSGMVKYSVAAKNIELATQTLTRLKGNGNVNLQLTRMLVEMKD